MERKLFCILWSLLCLWNAFPKDKPLKNDGVDSVAFYVAEAHTAIYNDFPTALSMLKKAKLLAEESVKAEAMADVNYMYGIAYYVKGDYDISLKHFLDALEIYRKEGDQMAIAKSLVGQGLIQQGIDRHDEAVNFFKQAITAYEKAGNYKAANPAFLNIAISEIEEGEYEKAKKNLQTALELSKQAGRIDVEHLSLNKLGHINFMQGKPEEAIKYFFQVLEHKTEPNGWEKSFAYAGLAESYEALGKFNLAEESGRKAMVFANKLHSLWDLERNTKILSSIYNAKGSMGEAFDYLKLNAGYKDSLYNQDKLREINLLQLKSKEADNLRLQAEREVTEKQLFINKIFIAALVLVTLFLLVMVLQFRRNSRQKEKFNSELREKNRTILEQNHIISQQNEELSEMNEAKNRLFSILSHDLRSPIGSLQQLLELIQSGDFTPEEQAGLLDEMLIQVTGTSSMLHNLLHWANSQLEGNKTNFEELELAPRVSKVVDAYYLVAKSKNITILHEKPFNLPKILVDNGHLSVIIHNLLSNALKYTLEGREIRISYEEKEGEVLLKILDGGHGISEEKIKEIKDFNNRMISQMGTGMEIGTGIGLMLVKYFLNINNATLDIKSHPGEGSEFMVAFRKA